MKTEHGFVTCYYLCNIKNKILKGTRNSVPFLYPFLDEEAAESGRMRGYMESNTAYVTAVHRGRYELETEGNRFFGRMKAAKFLQPGKAEVFPTVGDKVEVNFEEHGDSIITKVLPRKSVFMRLNATQGQPDQAVAANFDYVFIVMSLNGDFHETKLERYLTVAWQSGGTPVLILSKADTCENIDEYRSRAKKAAPGVEILCLSAKTGMGMQALEPFIGREKTIVLTGSSGVGKSSLINALMGKNEMRTGEIREADAQGRHTTTYRQCFRLPEQIALPDGTQRTAGGKIIDTPGMRTLHVSKAEKGVTITFNDVEVLSRQCRFSNCTHNGEPGCAIRTALDDGSLTEKRWQTYLSMKREEQYAKQREIVLSRKMSRTKQKYKRNSRMDWE